MVTIKIDDKTKCTTPYLCKKCLEVCPEIVFSLGVTELKRGTKTDPSIPGSFKLVPLYRDTCTMCMKCVEVCPLDAIEINWVE